MKIRNLRIFPRQSDVSAKRRLVCEALIFALLVIIFVPGWQVAAVRKTLTVEQAESLKVEHRKTWIQVLGGGGILFGLWLTWRRIKVTEDGQVTERFTKAIELLRDENLSSRLGAIYALERIAKDSERDHWAVIEILTAYFRERAPWDRPAVMDQDVSDAFFEPPKEKPRLAPELQAILTVIGRRRPLDSEEYRIDLSGVDLSGARLPAGCNFENALFVGSNLYAAIFSGCNLRKADFSQAILRGTVFKEAILDDAMMVNTDLGGTYVQGASVRGLNIAEERISKLDFLTLEQKKDLAVWRWKTSDHPGSLVVSPAKPTSSSA